MSAPIVKVTQRGAGFEVTTSGVWVATTRDRTMALFVATRLRQHFADSEAATVYALPELEVV